MTTVDLASTAGSGRSVAPGTPPHSVEETTTQPYDEDEDAERQLLIRAEADAARREATPIAEYGHMPVQRRGPMAKMSDWFLNKEIHDRFALYMRCN